MDYYYFSLFEDLGIPAKCPTCANPSWEFYGDTQAGITSVTCHGCGRHYRRGTMSEALRGALDMLRSSLYGDCDRDEQERLWEHLFARYSFYRADPTSFVVYCDHAGTPERDPNEAPF